MKKKTRSALITDIIVLVVVLIAVCVSMAFAESVDIALGLAYKVPVYADLPSDIGAAPDKLKVHFVDVGQGDCAVIELPDGKTMLIDGGENNKTVEGQIKTFVETTLPSGFKYFDYCILTHPDSDHCGSLDYALNNYPARISYRPNVEAVGTKSSPYTDPGKADLKSGAVVKSTAAYANSIAAMYSPEADIDFTPEVRVTDPYDEAQTISGGSGADKYTFTFYSPLSDNYGTTESNASWNDYSPVMVLEYKGFKYAMSGDAEEDNLHEFVEKTNAAKTDGVTDKYDAFDDGYCVNVIKAGHHGSVNATTSEYLEAITSPEGAGNAVVVISCGEDNKYGHPHDAAVQRYKAIGVADENILRTDKDGDITLSVRVSADGTAVMFHGSAALGTEKTGETTEYKKFGKVELKWVWLAWIVFAVVAVAVVIHIVIAIGSDGNKKSGRDRR